MDVILSWLLWGAGALLLVAVVVAACEQLAREARGQRMDCGATHAEPRRASVDVPLDTASAALMDLSGNPGSTSPPAHQGPVTEAAARVVAVTQALSRAAHPGRSVHDGGRWMDTTPRVVGLAEPVLRDRAGSRQAQGTEPANVGNAANLATEPGARESQPQPAISRETGASPHG